mmetsp:Transcript_29142/g.40626  ORF Transcript_29142/g.40626 Transcript_29142/m.40626 type:complete len:155 (+) Transcript_29142:67-531(+)
MTTLIVLATIMPSICAAAATTDMVQLPYERLLPKQKASKLFKVRGNPRSSKPKWSPGPNVPKPRKNKPGTTHRFSKVGRAISARINEKIIQVSAGQALNSGYEFRTPSLRKIAEHGKFLLTKRGKEARQIKRANRALAKKSSSSLRLPRRIRRS